LRSGRVARLSAVRMASSWSFSRFLRVRILNSCSAFLRCLDGFRSTGWRLLRNHFEPVLLPQVEAAQADEVGEGLVEGSFMPGFVAAIEGVMLVVADLGVGLADVIGLEFEGATTEPLVTGEEVDQVVFGGAAVSIPSGRRPARLGIRAWIRIRAGRVRRHFG
jgi:hypothetical protein